MLQQFEFLKREFFRYYYENINEIVPPSPIRNREFGFFLEKDRGMLRHKCFNNLEDFQRFVLDETPLNIYVSAANYEDPGNRDMAGKKLINTELFFDIDTEPSAFPEEQDSAWICRKCGQYDLGMNENCLACGSKTEVVRLVSEEQLKEASKETGKLIRILMDDFGVEGEHVSVFFSGNRGYHVHVDQEEFLNLSGEGRREIVDYLLIQGLDEKELFNLLREERRTRIRNLKGTRGRIYSRVLEMLYTLEKSKTPSGKRTVLKALNNAVEELKVRIDPVVTIDMHRLMRMPNSINSNSGMIKKRIRLEELSSFNPLKEAIAFGDEETALKVRVAPRFKLGGRTFGPFKDENVKLPAYAAVYLVCKGLGENVGGE